MAIRTLSKVDAEQVTPLHVSNEQGVTDKQRFVIQNLASNPESVKRYLKGLGYEVRPFGKGFNFAVKKPGDDKWGVVDPEGFDSINDVWDLVGDVAQGFLVTGATLAGGGVGSFASGAAAGAGSELLRQSLGEAAGLEGNINPTQIVAQGAAGLVSPALGAVGGKLAGSANRFVAGTGKVLRSLGAKAAGVEGTPNLAAERALALRAGAARASKKVETLGAAARSYGKSIRRLSATRIPESATVGKMVQDATNNGVTVNLEPAIERLMAHTGNGIDDASKAVLARERSVAPATENLIERIFDRLGPSARMDALSPVEANEVKSILQNEAARKGAFTEGAKNLTSSSQYRALTARVSTDVRRSIEDAMGGANSQFASTMRSFERKVKLLNYLKTTIKGKTREESDAKAERFLRGVFGNSPEAGHAALRNAEKWFGVDLLSRGESAAAAERFGEAGAVGIVPRFTATGTILGTSLLGGAGGGFPGMAGGALAGAALASPRTIVGATRFGQKYVGPVVGASMRGAGKVLNAKSMRLAATAALQAAARAQSGGSKAVASETQAKRKAYFTGS